MVFAGCTTYKMLCATTSSTGLEKNEVGQALYHLAGLLTVITMIRKFDGNRHGHARLLPMIAVYHRQRHMIPSLNSSRRHRQFRGTSGGRGREGEAQSKQKLALQLNVRQLRTHKLIVGVAFNFDVGFSLHRVPLRKPCRSTICAKQIVASAT